MKKLLFSIFITTFSVLTYASPAEDLAQLLNAVRTMRANFTQTVYDNHGKAVQTSKGQMSLQRPGKFRWEVTSPIPQVIIANGAKLWIYDPDLEQVTIRSLQKSSGDTPALLLSDVDSVLTNAYNITPSPQKEDSRTYTLIPKSADNMFASIRLAFVKDQVREMRLEDHLGHVTSVRFQQIQTNVNLPATLFTFKRPANVDVIDETRKNR